MSSGSAQYRKRLKESDPEKYAEYLRKQVERRRKREEEKKRKWAEEVITPAMVEQKERELRKKRESYHRVRERKMTQQLRLIRTSSASTTGTPASAPPKREKKYKDMTEEEIKAHRNLLRRQSRSRQSHQKKAAVRKKNREYMQQKREESKGKAKLKVAGTFVADLRSVLKRIIKEETENDPSQDAKIVEKMVSPRRQGKKVAGRVPLSNQKTQKRLFGEAVPNPSKEQKKKKKPRQQPKKAQRDQPREKLRGKWIAMNTITYEDPTGQERTWEGISRTTKQGTEADAVGIITLFRDPELKCDCVVLVRQYRPPMEAYTVEFPAGLIDAGETAEKAAVREMWEETGYKVKAKFVSPATSLDPGIGNTTIKFVTCEVDLSDLGSKRPQPAEPDEFTEVIIQPLNSLLPKLEEFSKAKDIVDSRVYTWALARCG